MPLIIVLCLIYAAAWKFEPLVYEGFESNVSATGSIDKPDITSRTCVFLSGHLLISHTLQGKWDYACPRRRGEMFMGSPGNLFD